MGHTRTVGHSTRYALPELLTLPGYFWLHSVLDSNQEDLVWTRKTTTPATARSKAALLIQQPVAD
jgi:hypothetical protein